MSPVLAKNLWPAWDAPLDGGRKWRGREIFGAHKTYRGIISGTIVGFVIFCFQRELFKSYPFVRELSAFNYQDSNVALGAIMGLSALLGDLIKSFVKRRLGISSGRSWIPFDQVDWIIGVLLGVTIVFVPDLFFIVTSLVVGVALHFFIKLVGYILHLSEVPL